MRLNDNISEFKERVQHLIAADRVQEAIDEIIPWVRRYTDRKEPLYEILVVSAHYRRLDRQIRQGLLPFEEYQLHTNKLLYQIFGLLEEVVGEDDISLKVIANKSLVKRN